MKTFFAICFLAFVAVAPSQAALPEDKICHREGNNRDPEDCGVFITCILLPNGTWRKQKMSCPAGLAYGESKDQCLQPKDVKGCEDYVPKEMSKEEKVPEEKPKKNEDKICHREGNNRDPEDCGVYITCTLLPNGTWRKQKMSCPAGLAYEESKDQCLQPKDVKGCEDYTPKEMPKEEKVPEEKPVKDDEVKCTQEGYMRNPKDCGTYFACLMYANGTFYKLKMTCPKGLAYDEVSNKCLQPSDVKGCEDYQKVKPIEEDIQARYEKDNGITNNGLEGKFFHWCCHHRGHNFNPLNICQSYCACKVDPAGNWIYYIEPCPENLGLAYSIRKHKCVPKKEVWYC